MNTKSKKPRIIALVVVTLAVLIIYWFMLPALNPVCPAFWGFVLLAVLLYGFAVWITGAHRFSDVTVQSGTGRGAVRVGFPETKGWKIFGFIIVGAALLALILWLIGLPIFNASSYNKLIVKEDGNFSEDIAELSMNQIPVVDRDTASQLGKRKLGEMNDLVSQFEISEDYTQINYHNRPVRVTPLVYGDIFKWLNNYKRGIPAYLQVDMVTQETTLVRLDQGMKYAPCEYFLRDLTRHLRFAYPTKMFDTYSFEVDENGTPYWIAPTICYRIGVWGGEDINGAVVVNAITGEMQYYPDSEVPDWVDRVYRSDLVIDQLNYNGRYQNGFFNSIIGQRGVLQTTNEYNYIADNNAVYLFTGLTSTTGDQSNVGFVLVNMRTKETKYYAVPGAQESSAMSSAEGQVQHLNYKATSPLLLNVADRPTYFMSLKDAAGLVKMYAYVDVESYQIVGTGSSVAEANASYVKALTAEEGVSAGSGQSITGIVTQVTSAVVDGNTKYYFTLQGGDTVYIAPITVSNRLPFLKAGDSIALSYSGDDSTREVLSIQ